MNQKRIAQVILAMLFLIEAQHDYDLTYTDSYSLASTEYTSSDSASYFIPYQYPIASDSDTLEGPTKVQRLPRSAWA